jgi:hypothetical protein
MKLWFENKEWLDSFIQKYNRVPRILHISNIANNAYNNAKLLNQCGLENHVIACHDSYAMGCPEWEDADFDEDIEDLWHPPWEAFDLKGFVRPYWFAQGGYHECFSYLIRVINDDPKNKNQDANKSASKITFFFKLLPKRILKIILEVVKKVFLVIDHIFKTEIYLNSIGIYLNLRIAVKKFTYRMRLNNDYQEAIKSSILKRETLNEKEKKISWPEKEDQLIGKFALEFPNRIDKLNKKDFNDYYFTRDGFSELMNHYDLVIGYAVEGVYPLMSNKPYIAFEHGTIRDIPYAADTQGRLCSLVYRMASHVFVTNFDCKKSAEYFAPNRHTLINHPFDEDHGLSCQGWGELRQDLLVRLNSDLLFFFPTRQDWVSGDGYADKANDVFIRAAARLRRSGHKVGIVCCNWGRNVLQTKDLIELEGLQESVVWVNPMGVIKFERYAKACDIVVDQFKLGSFGGVLFKAMAVGAPILTYLDEKNLLKQYPEIPPVLNCKTSEEIESMIIPIYNNPKILQDLRTKSIAWIKKYHSKETTANLELKVISSLIN